MSLVSDIVKEQARLVAHDKFQGAKDSRISKRPTETFKGVSGLERLASALDKTRNDMVANSNGYPLQGQLLALEISAIKAVLDSKCPHRANIAFEVIKQCASMTSPKAKSLMSQKLRPAEPIAA